MDSKVVAPITLSSRTNRPLERNQVIPMRFLGQAEIKKREIKKKRRAPKPKKVKVIKKAKKRTTKKHGKGRKRHAKRA